MVGEPNWVSIGVFLLGFLGQAMALVAYINKQGDRALERIGRVEQRIFDKLTEAQNTGDAKREALAQLFSERIEGVRSNLELLIRAEIEKQNDSRHKYNQKLTEDYKAFTLDLKALEREIQRVERETARKDELARFEGQISQSINRIEASIIARIDKGDAKVDALSGHVAELVAIEKHRQIGGPPQQQQQGAKA
jgi:hypothetical protein